MEAPSIFVCDGVGIDPKLAVAGIVEDQAVRAEPGCDFIEDNIEVAADAETLLGGHGGPIPADIAGCLFRQNGE